MQNQIITRKILDDINLSQVGAFIFDCDGTLIDSMPMHNQIWQQLLKKHGLAQAFPRILELAGTPDQQIVAILNQEYDADLDAVMITAEKLALALQHAEQITAIDAIVDIAKQYYQKIPLAVVSGGERVIVEKSLANHQLQNLFETIICADVPVKSKPSSEIFLYAAQQLDVSPEACHVFEDGDGGIAGALQAGMTVTDVRLYL